MCGFVCLARNGGLPDRVLLATMAATLNHRGPDGEGVYLSRGVGMHHKRLSIIDLHGGAQPMQSGDVAVSFNGEIYNYVELRDELVLLGHTFATQSDTEVLLRMYLEYGPEFVRRLNGMFAFVIHDARNDRLIAARDHFGIKPLYWMRTPDGVAFASEIKALLVHPDAPRRLDPIALEDYLALQFVMNERTMFGGIHKLEPAHRMVLDLSAMTPAIERYWQPDYENVIAANEETERDEVRSLVMASVQRQMRSDVPVGAYLSGGLDSSFVASAAARQGSSHRLATFTGAFVEGPEYDETPFAREVASHLHADWHVIYPSDQDFIDLLPRLAWAMDEPAAGPGLFPQAMVSRLASEHVKVCLGGQGGDEIFVGYARYLIGALEQALLDRIRDRPISPHSLTLANLEHCLGTLKTYMPLLSRAWGHGVEAAPDMRYFRILDRLDASAALLGDEWTQRMALSEVRQRFSAIFNRPARASQLKKMMHFDLSVTMPTLLHVEDRASMSASIESRVPLLDPALVQRVAAISDRSLLADGFSKSVLRHAARGLLPPTVLNRTDKMGFPVPLQHWVRGPARRFVEDVLLSPQARQRGIYAPQQIENLIGNEAAFGRTLWGALQLELWHRTFIDAAPQPLVSVQTALDVPDVHRVPG